MMLDMNDSLKNVLKSIEIILMKFSMFLPDNCDYSRTDIANILSEE